MIKYNYVALITRQVVLNPKLYNLGDFLNADTWSPFQITCYGL